MEIHLQVCDKMYSVTCEVEISWYTNLLSIIHVNHSIIVYFLCIHHFLVHFSLPMLGNKLHVHVAKEWIGY